MNTWANRKTSPRCVQIKVTEHSAKPAGDNANLPSLDVDAKIEERVAQRTAGLKAFAHTVSHQLKNSVGIILGYANMMNSDYDGFSENERREHLYTIEQTAAKMECTINALLLLAEAQGKEGVDIQPIDMACTVTSALCRVSGMLEKYSSKISFPKQWPVAYGYAPWVEEVWVNYLSNALKYGGKPASIELGAQVQPDGMVRFWVQDNGPGLSPEDQAKLFDKPFTRLDSAACDGHGLGLLIVRQIVEKLGGKVGIRSEIGRGSTFSFTLPGTTGFSASHPERNLATDDEDQI